ncbi:hypothetical protein RJ639_005712 [Escallonia herrerae]|uniref:C3H1-type domain-containing protein n=1 Tax=Escallonia herrerae TaxID=1293975 RepID=A0AA89AUN6_9ASTE|nr:hypothetical protein RJ639_005712 [Escallonia herrerae]
MPTAAAAVTSGKSSDSDRESSLADDEEYEEIEVEVEEEVEEEEEEEEEEEQNDDDDNNDEGADVNDEEAEVDGDEIGEDLSLIDDHDHRQDEVQVMGFKGHEEHLRSGSSNQEKSVAILASDTRAVEDSRGNPQNTCLSETIQEEESRADGKRTPKVHFDAHYGTNAPQYERGTRNAETAQPLGVFGKEMTAAVSMHDGFNEETNGILLSDEETKRMSMQSGEDIKKRAARLDVPVIRPRSLSPGVEFNNGNKRPAVVCDFFAKGWCIKGNSCRFLHAKDHVEVNSQQHASAGDERSKPQASEGLRDSLERSILDSFPDASASASAENPPSSSERIPAQEHGESPRWKSESQELHVSNMDTRIMSATKDVEIERLKQNWYLGKYENSVSPVVEGSSPISRGSSDCGTFLSGSVLSLDPYQRAKTSSFATSLEEIGTKRNHFMLHDSCSSIFCHSLHPSSSSSQRTTGIYPLEHIPDRTRLSMSFGSSPWNSDPLGTQKCVDDDREYPASVAAALQRSSSPFSLSELEHRSWTNVSGDPFRQVGYQTEIFSNDWEPSIPFRPSSFLTRCLSSPGTQYDPIRDSIDSPKSDGLPKFSSSSLGTSVVTTTLQRNVDPFPGTFLPEYSSDKHSLASHHQLHDSLLDSNDFGKDLLIAERETTGSSVAEWRSRSTLAKEEKLLIPPQVRDISKTNKVNSYHDLVLQADGTRNKGESKVDRARQNAEMDIDLMTDANVQKESKAMKHFRTALIDFVKELVKPSWREGHLSKDAHKVIVKKAVEKVLRALPTHQIPSTAEAIELYLSSSQQKISKLVEKSGGTRAVEVKLLLGPLIGRGLFITLSRRWETFTGQQYRIVHMCLVSVLIIVQHHCSSKELRGSLLASKVPMLNLAVVIIEYEYGADMILEEEIAERTASLREGQKTFIVLNHSITNKLIIKAKINNC